MRDVVVVGGGLTGLSAAYELAQHELDVTLIEVKRQTGGSIRSIKQDACILDEAAFAIHDSLDSEWLKSIGLDDALFPLAKDAVAFKDGTGSLIGALMKKITATRLMRMAVSSIGELDDGRFSICMENGLMFDAKSLILAVPARYAGRMFYGYINPITEQLLDYHYDSLYRVSLVCQSDALPSNLTTPPDMAYVFIHRTEYPSRVPDGYSLLQFGIRLDSHRVQSPDDLVNFVCKQFQLPEVFASHVGYWQEADPISCYEDEHQARVNTIREQLPQGIAVVGSDYNLENFALSGIVRLDERIQQGIDAVNQVLETL